MSGPCPPVAGLCVQALSSCPLWRLGSVSRPCPPLVLCGWALCPGLVLFLSLSWPRPCGWALWPGSVSGSCPPLVLVLAAHLNSVLVSVARLTGEECGRTNSDVNADKNSLMKQFALGVKVRRTKKSFGAYGCIIPFEALLAKCGASIEVPGAEALRDVVAVPADPLRPGAHF